jgi:hypothetical protein
VVVGLLSSWVIAVVDVVVVGIALAGAGILGIAAAVDLGFANDLGLS